MKKTANFSLDLEVIEAIKGMAKAELTMQNSILTKAVRMYMAAHHPEMVKEGDK